MRSGQLTAARIGLATLLAGTAGVLADNDPNARFRGAPTYDLAVTNARWEPGTQEYSYVTFDLSWSFSWRAVWVEPAKTSVTGRDLRVESWDAAWVFVKFLPEEDSKESIERNHWRHATLSTDAADHVMPAGATNTVGLTDDGTRGLGVFIHRDAVGHGANNFKGVKLRWLHGTDKVDPARAAIAVHPIAMVYVPKGPFKVGTGCQTVIGRFPDGPDVPVVGVLYDVEETGSFTDGSWRGGPTIPFLVDADWSGPAAEESNARRLGPVAGQLWGTFTFPERMPWCSTAGGPGALNDDFPTGYDAFYCMKYELTQGQYAAFLNSLPPDVAAARAFVSGDESCDVPSKLDERRVEVGPGLRPHVNKEQDGHTITSSADKPLKTPLTPDAAGSTGFGKPDADAATDRVLDGLTDDVMAGEKAKHKPTPPPVYTARLPFRRCNYTASSDALAYAAWAGLRPMTELEFEKACRGPRQPVPNECVWGKPPARRSSAGYLAPKLLDADLPTERPDKGNCPNPFYAHRVGALAAADSDRFAAGASYWGIMDMNGCDFVVSVGTGKGRAFRGMHGDGRVPAGELGGPIKRPGTDPKAGFDTVPADWPPVGGRGRLVSLRNWSNVEYLGRHSQKDLRLVFTTGNGTRRRPRPVVRTAARPVAPSPARPADPRRPDHPKVTNAKWEAATRDYSYVTFDLAWESSWRATWTELAESSVTGKPLKIESWDAAWVFVKFREPGARDDSPATLSTSLSHHVEPDIAALDVGLSDDGKKGAGVFIYRGAVGHGPNDFRNVKLRWLHGADQAGPAKAVLTVHAIAMVYVPEGPFASKSPWGDSLTPITTADPRQAGGHLGTDPRTVPEHRTWPNGYEAFYCMKYSISQGQFADFLNSVASDLKSADCNKGRYQTLPGEARRYHAALYNFNGYTIRTNAAGRYVADRADQACNCLSWPDIVSYTAWAALRPPTNLEYEKACRGPRAPAKGRDAWSAEDTAPAAALLAGGQLAPSAGASYWGIRQLSLSGCVQEWPATIQNGLPTPEHRKGAGCGFKGTHGDGTPEAPEDWPWTAFGDWHYGGIWRNKAFSDVGIWFLSAELDRLRSKWWILDSDRTGRYGARAVRKAP